MAYGMVLLQDSSIPQGVNDNFTVMWEEMRDLFSKGGVATAIPSCSRWYKATVMPVINADYVCGYCKQKWHSRLQLYTELYFAKSSMGRVEVKSLNASHCSRCIAEWGTGHYDPVFPTYQENELKAAARSICRFIFTAFYGFRYSEDDPLPSHCSSKGEVYHGPSLSKLLVVVPWVATFPDFVDESLPQDSDCDAFAYRKDHCAELSTVPCGGYDYLLLLSFHDDDINFLNCHLACPTTGRVVSEWCCASRDLHTMTPVNKTFLPVTFRRPLVRAFKTMREVLPTIPEAFSRWCDISDMVMVHFKVLCSSFDEVEEAVGVTGLPAVTERLIADTGALLHTTCHSLPMQERRYDILSGNFGTEREHLVSHGFIVGNATWRAGGVRFHPARSTGDLEKLYSRQEFSELYGPAAGYVEWMSSLRVSFKEHLREQRKRHNTPYFRYHRVFYRPAGATSSKVHRRSLHNLSKVLDGRKEPDRTTKYEQRLTRKQRVKGANKQRSRVTDNIKIDAEEERFYVQEETPLPMGGGAEPKASSEACTDDADSSAPEFRNIEVVMDDTLEVIDNTLEVMDDTLEICCTVDEAATTESMKLETPTDTWSQISFSGEQWEEQSIIFAEDEEEEEETTPGEEETEHVEATQKADDLEHIATREVEETTQEEEDELFTAECCYSVCYKEEEPGYSTLTACTYDYVVHTEQATFSPYEEDPQLCS